MPNEPRRRPAAADGDWQKQLVAVAHEQLRVYRTHPWLVTAGFRPGAAGPNALRYFDRCLAILAEARASAATKMEALATLTGVVTLFARPAASDAVDPATIFSAIDPVAHRAPDRGPGARPAGPVRADRSQLVARLLPTDPAAA